MQFASASTANVRRKHYLMLTVTDVTAKTFPNQGKLYFTEWSPKLVCLWCDKYETEELVKQSTSVKNSSVKNKTFV